MIYPLNFEFKGEKTFLNYLESLRKPLINPNLIQLVATLFKKDFLFKTKNALVDRMTRSTLAFSSPQEKTDLIFYFQRILKTAYENPKELYKLFTLLNYIPNQTRITHIDTIIQAIIELILEICKTNSPEERELKIENIDWSELAYLTNEKYSGEEIKNIIRVLIIKFQEKEFKKFLNFIESIKETLENPLTGEKYIKRISIGLQNALEALTQNETFETILFHSLSSFVTRVTEKENLLIAYYGNSNSGKTYVINTTDIVLNTFIASYMISLKSANIESLKAISYLFKAILKKGISYITLPVRNIDINIYAKNFILGVIEYSDSLRHLRKKKEITNIKNFINPSLKILPSTYEINRVITNLKKMNPSLDINNLYLENPNIKPIAFFEDLDIPNKEKLKNFWISIYPAIFSEKRDEGVYLGISFPATINSIFIKNFKLFFSYDESPIESLISRAPLVLRFIGFVNPDKVFYININRVDELKTNLFRKNLFEQVLLYIRDWILGNKSSPIIESLNNVLGFDLVSLAESDNTFDQQELTKKLNENSLARFIYNLKKLTTHQLQKQFDDDWNTLGNDLKELYGCKDKKSCFEKYIKDTLNDHIENTLYSINNKKFLNDYIISDNVKETITTPDGEKVTLNAGRKVELALLDQFLRKLGIEPHSSGELREGGINPYYDIYENKDYTNVVRKLFQDFANGFYDNYYTADVPLNDLISYLSPLDAKKSRNINGEIRVLDNIAGELESIYDEEIKPFLEKYGLTDEDLINYNKYKQLEEKAKKDPNLRRDLLKLKKSILTSLKTGNNYDEYMNLLKLRVLGEKFKREGYVPNITQFGSNVTEEKIPFEGSFYDKSNRVIDILARFGGLFNPNRNKTITPEVLHNFLSDEEKFNKLLEKLLGDANAQKDKTDPRIVIEEYLKQHNPNASEDEIVKFVPEEIKKAVKERLTKIGSRIEKNFDKLTKIFEENAENISKEGAGSQILEGMFNQIIKSYSELKGMDKINLSSVYDGIINGLELGQDLSILDKHRLFNDFKKLANSVGICEISIKKGEIKSTQVPSRYIKNFTYMLEVAKRVMPDDGFKRFATSLVTSAFGFTPVGLAFLEEFGVITPKKEKRVLFNTADDLINHTFNRIRNEINIDKMSKNEALEKLTDIIKEFVAEFNKNKDKFRENLGDNDILLEDPLQVLGIGLLKRTEKN